MGQVSRLLLIAALRLPCHCLAHKSINKCNQTSRLPRPNRRCTLMLPMLHLSTVSVTWSSSMMPDDSNDRGLKPKWDGPKGIIKINTEGTYKLEGHKALVNITHLKVYRLATPPAESPESPSPKPVALPASQSNSEPAAPG